MKKMKKSLFMTTIAMVVMLVVALSTATYAWFTAQNTVQATPVTISSASSTSANIAIGWSANATTTQVSFANAELNPMVPTTDPSTTTSDALDFNKGQLSISPAGVPYFNGVSGDNPWTPSEYDGEGSTLYVKNNNPNAGVSVQLSGLTVAGTNLATIGGLLRVAFYTAGASAGTYVYLGTYGSGNAYYGVPHAYNADDGEDAYTLAAEAAFKTADNLITLKNTAAGIAPFTLAASGSVQLFIYAWLEGTGLTDALASQSITFSFAFNGTEVPNP